MEDDCRNLDFQIICEKNLNTTNTYINSWKKLHKIEKEIQKLTNKLSFLNNAIITKYNLFPVMKNRDNHYTRIG